MVREKLYTRQGSRFVPVHECRYFDVLPEGAWLVIVGPGNTAIRRVLNPAYAELEAAMRTAEDAMCTAMLEASKLRPMFQSTPLREGRLLLCTILFSLYLLNNYREPYFFRIFRYSLFQRTFFNTMYFQ